MTTARTRISQVFGAVILATGLWAAPTTAQAAELSISFMTPGGSVHYSSHDAPRYAQPVHYGPRHHWTGSAYGRYHAMPPRAARRIAWQAGYRDPFVVDFRGRNYVVQAFDWRGRQVRLKVNAFTGEIRRGRYAYR